VEQIDHSLVWYLEIEKEDSSLIGAASRPGNAGLPVTTMSIKRHCLNTFKWISSQRFQLTAQSPMSPRAFNQWTRVLPNTVQS